MRSCAIAYVTHTLRERSLRSMRDPVVAIHRSMAVIEPLDKGSGYLRLSQGYVTIACETNRPRKGPT